MTQNIPTAAPAEAPPVGTRIQLDDVEYVVAEVTDPGIEWYISKQGLRAPVYLLEANGEGEWIVESAAHLAEYGTVLA